MDAAKYRIYTDESGWKEEFASIAAITINTKKLKDADIKEFEEKWQKLITEIGTKEIKFKSVTSSRKIEIIKEILKSLRAKENGGLRIDILTWEKKDKLEYEQTEQHPQDKTLAVMYYFLLIEIVRKNKGKMNHKLYADRADQLERHWKTSQYVLTHEWKEVSEKIKENLSVPKEDSKDHVFIQLADIMAGFMRHTYDKDYVSFRDKRKKRTTEKPKKDKDYKNHLCYEIEKWLTSIGIKFYHRRDGGCMCYVKDQAVNLWKFKKGHAKDKNSKEEINNTLTLFQMKDEKRTESSKENKPKSGEESNNNPIEDERPPLDQSQLQLYELSDPPRLSVPKELSLG